MDDKDLRDFFYSKFNLEEDLKQLAKKIEVANRTDRTGTVWPTFEDYVKYGDTFTKIELIETNK